MRTNVRFPVGAGTFCVGYLRSQYGGAADRNGRNGERDPKKKRIRLRTHAGCTFPNTLRKARIDAATYGSAIFLQSDPGPENSRRRMPNSNSATTRATSSGNTLHRRSGRLCRQHTGKARPLHRESTPTSFSSGERAGATRYRARSIAHSRSVSNDAFIPIRLPKHLPARLALAVPSAPPAPRDRWTAPSSTTHRSAG